MSKKHIDFSNETTSWIRLYYGAISELINKYKSKSYVEVGLGLGQHIEKVLDDCPELEIAHGIDPYKPYDDNDGFQINVSKIDTLISIKENFDKLCEAIINRINSRHKTRFNFIRNESISASKTIADESIDLIFIDGDHRYQYVLEDCRAWYKKIKVGGIMAGDDYRMKDVERAVKDFAKEINKELKLIKVERSGYLIWVIEK